MSYQTSNLKIKRLTISNHYQKRRMMQSDSPEAWNALSQAAGIQRDNRAQQVEVQTGVRDLLRTEITAGMAEGEAVVIEGMDGLKPGARVTTTELPMSKHDPLPEAAAQKNSL